MDGFGRVGWIHTRPRACAGCFKNPTRALAASLLILDLSACTTSFGATSDTQQLVSSKDFVVYDVLIYKGKPDVSSLGMRPATGTGMFWAPDASRDSVDTHAVRGALDAWKNYRGLFYLDVEVWPVCFAPDTVVSRNIAKFTKFAHVARRAAPKLRMGFYAVVPAHTYWPIVSGDSAKMREWRKCNERLRTLARQVDVILPSLYTFYEDERGWEVYATAILRAARRYGKPVYAFLWPEFHDSNKKLAGTNVPGPYWRRELELCRREADGIVLWNGLKREWDETAPWWIETKAFLHTLQEQR